MGGCGESDGRDEGSGAKQFVGSPPLNRRSPCGRRFGLRRRTARCVRTTSATILTLL